MSFLAATCHVASVIIYGAALVVLLGHTCNGRKRKELPVGHGPKSWARGDKDLGSRASMVLSQVGPPYMVLVGVGPLRVTSTVGSLIPLLFSYGLLGPSVCSKSGF